MQVDFTSLALVKNLIEQQPASSFKGFLIPLAIVITTCYAAIFLIKQKHFKCAAAVYVGLEQLEPCISPPDLNVT